MGPEYLAWLDRTWRGDTRELREGRYLHQQADLRAAFETSPYWRTVSSRLYGWAEAYAIETGEVLFPGAPTVPKLDNKSWESFLSRTWRQNRGRNENWPAPPTDGWWLPDNWFERAWDIVRTRFVVRYMDGVAALAEDLVRCAHEFGMNVELVREAKEHGYYAFHVKVRQPFAVAPLDDDERQYRTSVIEIQVMTELAEVISALTHAYYEVRREGSHEEIPWQWNWDAEETTAFELALDSSRVEREVMRLREKIHARANGQTPRAASKAKHKRRRGSR